MDWDGSPSLGSGVDAFLSRLSANGQPDGHRAFPPGVDRATLRFQGAETIKQWFTRCVAAFMPEGLEFWQLEENLAAFAYVSWRAGNELDYVTINILEDGMQSAGLPSAHRGGPRGRGLEGDEQAAIHAARSRLRHPRADRDPSSPARPFQPGRSAPITLDAAARQMSSWISSILPFYRHYFPRRWVDWARQTWDRHYKDRNGDPEMNPFDAIVASYGESQMGVIRSRVNDIAELVSVLHEARSRMYDLRMNGDDRRLTSSRTCGDNLLTRPSRPRYRHPRRGRLPHQGDLFRGQAVRLVDQVADLALQAQRLPGQDLGGEDGPGVLLSEATEGREAQGVLLAAKLPDLGDERLGVEVQGGL